MMQARKNTESNKERFSNWIQCVISVSTTKTAFHNYVKREWRDQISTWGTDEQKQLMQFLQDVGAENVNRSAGRIPRWSMTCHQLCDNILQRLVILQRNPKFWNTSLCKSLGSANVSSDVQIWCLANMFLLPETASTKGPADTDASAFFQMMKNCKLFNIDDGDRLYENMLEVRTKIHHSATYLLNKDVTRQYLRAMTELLEAFDEPECKSAVTKIREMERQLLLMVSVPDETFQKMAANALDLQKNFLSMEIEYNKKTGLTADDLTAKREETDMEVKRMKGSPSRYGLKSRREYKEDNQKYSNDLKQMKDMASNMERIKTMGLQFKAQIQKLNGETTPVEAKGSENLVDILLKKVTSLNPYEARKVLVGLCSSLSKDMKCMKMDIRNSCVCGKCTCR